MFFFLWHLKPLTSRYVEVAMGGARVQWNTVCWAGNSLPYRDIPACGQPARGRLRGVTRFENSVCMQYLDDVEMQAENAEFRFRPGVCSLFVLIFWAISASVFLLSLLLKKSVAAKLDARASDLYWLPPPPPPQKKTPQKT